MPNAASPVVRPDNPVMNWDHPMARGLVGFWTWDGDTTKARDVLERGLDAPNSNGTPTVGIGPHGRTSYIDKVRYEIPAGTVIPNSETFTHHTFEWLAVPHTSGTQQYGSLFTWGGSNGDQWIFGVNFSGSSIRMYATSQISGADYGITKGTLIHAVAVWDGSSNWILYVNGARVASGTHSSPTLSGTARYLCGDSRGGGSNTGEYWDGGEVYLARVWNVVKTAQEVTELYRDPWEILRPTPIPPSAAGGGGCSPHSCGSAR